MNDTDSAVATPVMDPDHIEPGDGRPQDTHASPLARLSRALHDSIGVELEDIAGTTVSGEVPLSAATINRMIAARLETTPVRSATVLLHDGNRFTAHVKLRAPLVPALKIQVRIEQQPDLPARPTLGLRWTIPGLGLLAAFAGPALTLFGKSLPAGIRTRADWVGVDVFELLRARGFGDMLPFLAGLRLTTSEGRALVEFKVRV
jgi:hypothetical protein